MYGLRPFSTSISGKNGALTNSDPWFAIAVSESSDSCAKVYNSHIPPVMAVNLDIKISIPGFSLFGVEMDTSCSPPVTSPSSALFPKIGKLKDVIYHARKLQETSFELVGTVKLHGTHADMVIDKNDFLRLQSRNQINLRLDSDNFGFAAFALPVQDNIVSLKNAIVARYCALNPTIPFRPEHPVVLAGEWCGGSIQKKVALQRLPRHFVICSINVNNSWVPDDCYSDIQDEAVGIYNISKAGYFQGRLDLQDVGRIEAEIKSMVMNVEKECPYARTFGVFGVGEGIVWKFRAQHNDPTFWFKSKGDEFAVSTQNKLAPSALAVENANRTRNFAQAIVTENRLQQGWGYLEEMQTKRDISSLGRFLTWIIEDCLVEEQREVAEANIQKHDLKPEIVRIAKTWYKAKVDATK